MTRHLSDQFTRCTNRAPAERGVERSARVVTGIVVDGDEVLGHLAQRHVAARTRRAAAPTPSRERTAARRPATGGRERSRPPVAHVPDWTDPFGPRVGRKILAWATTKQHCPAHSALLENLQGHGNDPEAGAIDGVFRPAAAPKVMCLGSRWERTDGGARVESTVRPQQADRVLAWTSA